MADVPPELPALLRDLAERVEEAEAACRRVMEIMHDWPGSNPIQSDPRLRLLVASMPLSPSSHTRRWLAQHPEINFDTPITQTQRLTHMLTFTREVLRLLEGAHRQASELEAGMSETNLGTTPPGA